MSEQNNVDKSVYEGAGFLLTHQGKFVLSARHKKAGDAAKDPIEEVEHFGGKPENEDQGDPYRTGSAELIEEAGGEFLDADWRDRVTVLHIFQPFSQKWIWCFLLELNDAELAKLKELDSALDDWELGTTRSFKDLTGREEEARKAIDGIATADGSDVIKYIQDFKNFSIPDQKNRMKEAKVYGKDETLLFNCPRLSNGEEVYRRRLRGFNLVIFEEHLDTIVNHLQSHV